MVIMKISCSLKALMNIGKVITSANSKPMKDRSINNHTHLCTTNAKENHQECNEPGRHQFVKDDQKA